MKPTKVIIDCDPGHDDAIALLMAHRMPEVDLIGVTTVCGNAPLERTTANCLRIMELLGATGVPVAAGCVTPLGRPLVLGTADGPSGLDGSPYLPEPTMELQKEHGVDFLARLLREAEEPVVLVPTGPLTNIGMLLLKYPDVRAKIARIVLMGGAFYRRDEYITPTEFNIFCDPEAAAIVVESGLDITMVGLDVTMKVLVEEPQFEAIGAIGTDLSKIVLDWLRYYEKLHRGQMGVGGALHDPLALAVAIDPTLIETRNAFVQIDRTGTHTFGATVADYWNLEGQPDNVKVASKVDADRFFEMLYTSLR
ncbi:nucleoside hydrolase [Hoeflea sp.]|uniref:nucleoside hydrolase n=1 Tax=Hoeflea sp. TaxID=1940281 RepID=UPI0019CA6CCE|nr:nucleoside hydrolase [Hoeflea sp.]MBC7281059.1 nucleoside hydrolase [Hoeflea sp.]